MNCENLINFCSPITLDQLPRLYFALVLLLLIPLSSFTAFQLSLLITTEIELRQLKSRDIATCAESEVLCLLRIMTRKKTWFDAVKLIELRQLRDHTSSYQLTNALGFIYQSMCNYELAELYYVEALRIKSDYIIALQNLAKVYAVTKQSRLLRRACQSILKLDSNNKIANSYLAE